MKKPGRTTKTASICLRISPRMKHLVDIMARRQRRSLAAVFESAVDAFASEEEIRIAEATWSTDENELILNLHRAAPNLCSFDEEVQARTLIQSGSISKPAAG